MFKKLTSFESVAVKHAYDLIDQYAGGCYISGIEAGPAERLETVNGLFRIRAVTIWIDSRPNGARWVVMLSSQGETSTWRPVGASYRIGTRSYHLTAVADAEYDGEYFFVPTRVYEFPSLVTRMQNLGHEFRREVLYEWGLNPADNEILPGWGAARSRLASK